MTLENPDFEKLPDFNAKDTRFEVRFDGGRKRFPVLFSIAETLELSESHVFYKALEIGINADMYHHIPSFGLFRDEVGYDVRIDPMDAEFAGPFEGIDIKPIKSNNLSGTFLFPSVTSYIKKSAYERDITAKDLVSRCERVGLMVINDMVESGLDKYHFYYPPDDEEEEDDENEAIKPSPITFAYIFFDSDGTGKDDQGHY